MWWTALCKSWNYSQTEKQWWTSVHVNAFRFVGSRILYVAIPDKISYNSDNTFTKGKRCSRQEFNPEPNQQNERGLNASPTTHSTTTPPNFTSFCCIHNCTFIPHVSLFPNLQKILCMKQPCLHIL